MIGVMGTENVNASRYYIRPIHFAYNVGANIQGCIAYPFQSSLLEKINIVEE